MSIEEAYRSDLALPSPVQGLDILLDLLLIDIWVLVPLTAHCHVEHPIHQLPVSIQCTP